MFSSRQRLVETASGEHYCSLTFGLLHRLNWGQLQLEGHGVISAHVR